MKALVYHGPKDIRYQDVEDPALADDADVIVKVTRAAICGSDLHLWHGAMPVPETGFVVGHEFVGVVDEVGPSVRTVSQGDRVLVSCTLGCGSCDSCRRRLFSGCSVTTAGGTRSNVFGYSSALPGGQAERVRVPFADVNTFPIPEGVSEEQALFLTDILPTADMGAQMAQVQPGDCVVVFGSGPVGALVQRCVQIRGAAQVIAVDLDVERRAGAKARGCRVIDPERGDLVRRVLKLTGGRGADAVIEAVGRPELVTDSLPLLRPGGRMSVVGVIVSSVELPWGLMLMRNLSVHAGLVNPQQHTRALLALLQSGRMDPTEIITHRLPLSEGSDGYQLFAERRDGVMKVVLSP